MCTDESTRLIEALRYPDAYSHVVGDIELTETHISWVLLTGEFAYKIKKPVRLEFLDFTTLERRQRFCQEELRLNRRTAPELYLDVVPIVGPIAAPHVEGDGDPIEFAVKMCQFPDDALVSRRLRDNALQGSDIDSIARAIADLHRQAAVAPLNTSYGTPSVVWRAVEGNFKHLRREPTVAKEIERLADWTLATFESCREEFFARREQGAIRECHGDLHAGNIVVLDQGVRLFDAIEFNEEFRWIDVLSDIAFTVMDMIDRGHPDFGHRLLNAYLEITGDYRGLQVWRSYLVYRALVRAKVASIRTAQSRSTNSDDRFAELSQYVSLAERLTHRRKSRLIITHGFSGSGKTTVTQHLLKSLGAVRIRSDVERKRLTGAESNSGVPSRAAERYSPEATDRTYQRLYDLAAAILPSAEPVIVDATFLMAAHRKMFRGLAARMNAEFQILDVQASEACLRQRIAARSQTGHDASEADQDVLSHQMRTHEPLSNDELLEAVVIESQQPQSEEQALGILRGGGDGHVP